MKTRKPQAIRAFVCALFCIISTYGKAQVPFKVIDGYSHWLNIIRDTTKVKPKEKLGLHELTALVNLAISDERVDLIVPILSVNGADSVAVFAYSKQLRKYFKRKPIQFISQDFPDDLGFQRIPLSMIKPTVVSFDSVYTYMYSNPLINSSKFSVDDLDRKEENFCCRVKGYLEKLGLIYEYFRHGILIYLDDPTGELRYAAF